MFYLPEWYDKVLSGILLFAELFGMVHTIGYFLNLLKVMKTDVPNLVDKPSPPLTTFPPIAVVLPSYKEPLKVIEDTLICFYNLSYPNKQLYLLDDSRYDKPWDTPEKIAEYKLAVEQLCKKIGVNLFRRKWHGAKAGIINDFIQFLNGKTPENLDFQPFQNVGLIPAKYIAIFDADMNPLPDFLTSLVPQIELEPHAAFIQTPQYYTNFETNRVAQAAGLQQVIFFEYICEGKGISNAMFCCGSNVLINIEALSAVGGFDETSVTEDFATSLKMHLIGWKTLYFNKVLAFGLGPEDLGGFFKQQFRWALGSLSVGVGLPRQFLSHFSKLPLGTWWEYFLSSTHYFIGWFFFIFTTFPVLFLFFNLPSFFMDTFVYVVLFLPYLFINVSTVMWTLSMRNFSPKYFINTVLVSSISFPIFIKASIFALLGIHGTFTVTPKDSSSILPLRDMWPQLLLMLICLSALAWGLERMYFERQPMVGLIANWIWCLYNTLVLSSIFHFNNDPRLAKE
jgi:cellulose synthase (UDP-forming)